MAGQREEIINKIKTNESISSILNTELNGISVYYRAHTLDNVRGTVLTARRLIPEVYSDNLSAILYVVLEDYFGHHSWELDSDSIPAEEIDPIVNTCCNIIAILCWAGTLKKYERKLLSRFNELLTKSNYGYTLDTFYSEIKVALHGGASVSTTGSVAVFFELGHLGREKPYFVFSLANEADIKNATPLELLSQSAVTVFVNNVNYSSEKTTSTFNKINSILLETMFAKMVQG